MAVRKVITRGKQTFRVKFFSRKNDCMIHCESMLEADSARFLAFSIRRETSVSVTISRPSSPVASQYQYPKALPYHGTRNPVLPSGRGFRAKFASRKNRRMVRCESLLEKNFLYLAEFARNVVSFDEQPTSISYRLNGKQLRYTPDFVLRWRDGSNWYVEVKPSELLGLDRNLEKFDAVGEHFRRQGDSFLTISEREIYHPVRLPLVRSLLRHRDSLLLDSLSEIEHINLRDFSTWGELANALDTSLATVCLADRLISCSMVQPVQSTSLISIYKESDDVALFI